MEDIFYIVCLMKILYWHINPVYLLPLNLPGLKNLEVVVWNENGQQILFCVDTDLVRCPHLCSALFCIPKLSLRHSPELPLLTWAMLGLFTTLSMGAMGKGTEYDTERKWTVPINCIHVSIFHEVWAWRARLRRNTQCSCQEYHLHLTFFEII